MSASMTRLYLVDDHLMLREGLRTLLEIRGYLVVGESANPTQALSDLVRLSPDVLLLDLQLGQRNGFELLAKLLSRQLSTRCVVLTSSAQPRDVAQAMRLGAGGYVFKESAGSELIHAIEAVMAGQKYLGTAVTQLLLQGQTSAEQDDPISALSPRERQMVVMLVNGQSSAEMGAAFHLSRKTVDTYRSRLMLKLGVSDLPGLVRLAIRCQLVDSGQ